MKRVVGLTSYYKGAPMQTHHEHQECGDSTGVHWERSFVVFQNKKAWEASRQ